MTNSNSSGDLDWTGLRVECNTHISSFYIFLHVFIQFNFNIWNEYKEDFWNFVFWKLYEICKINGFEKCKFIGRFFKNYFFTTGKSLGMRVTYSIASLNRYTYNSSLVFCFLRKPFYVHCQYSNWSFYYPKTQWFQE